MIRNKKFAKNFKIPMYKHILFNSCFNFLFCIVYCFSLMNVCIFPKSSFCSDILKNDFTQYFKIYVICFLGNTLRICCNFSYISFSVSRALSSISAKNKIGSLNEKLNINKFFFITFILSLGFSLFKIFEYKPNEFYANFDRNFPYNAYDLRYCRKIEIATSCKIFWSLNLINNILNNVLFLFLSLVIDVVMIRFSNKVIEEKKKLNSPHLIDAIKYKKKLNKMIITNGALFFISHVPEFLVTLLLLIFKNILEDFCFMFFSCYELIEIAQSFHFISIGLQFFIFNYFDHNFNQSFMNLKKMVLR